MSKMKNVLNVLLSLAIIVALFALMTTVSKVVYGIPLMIIILSFIGVKVNELKKYLDENS